MILRETSDSQWIVSQVDHARLAGDLAEAWGNGRVPGLPLTSWLLPAIRDHDEGWRLWEAEPTVTAEGRPRDFTSMPTDVATRLWTASIEICASGPPSSAEALRRLRRNSGEVTPDDAAILEALLTHRGSFNVDRLRTEVVTQEEISTSSFAKSLSKLACCGVIALLNAEIGGPAYAINLPATGSAPLGGYWVSRHFCALAEMAREHRADEPAEAMVLDEFLQAQAAKQETWKTAAGNFAGDEIERVLDTGFRYVQFFDRISLWLCMAEREEPWQVRLSSSLELTFTPRSPREIEVDPWPFEPAALELSVPVVAIEKAEFSGDVAFREALSNAGRSTLRWVLVRGTAPESEPLDSR